MRSRKTWPERLRPANLPHAVAWRARLWARRLAYYTSARFANLGARPPLLVYQMAKVGSTSVTRSLEAARLGYSVFHVHWLTDVGRDELRVRVRRQGQSLPRGYFTSLGLLANPHQSKPLHWRVVTLVRDPIAQRVSHLFEGIEYAHPELVGADARIDVERAQREVLGELRDPTRALAYVDGWFDRELRGWCGLDVYAQPFEPDRGYQILRRDGLDVLVIRTEDLSLVFSRAVAELLGLPNGPALLHERRTVDGPFGVDYVSFKRTLRVPAEVCEAIYAGRLARHFYTAAEREAFTARWTGESAQRV